MHRSPGFRVLLVAVGFLAAVALARFQPWSRPGPAGDSGPASSAGAAGGPQQAREELRVGFLPVT